MANTELQNQLAQLLENSKSYQSLDALKKGEMKMKLMNLPEEQMHQAIEVFIEEQKKMAAATQEVTDASGEVKQQSKRLHTMSLKIQSDKELEESARSSEEILKSLPSTIRKKGCFGVVVILLVPVAAVLLQHILSQHS